MSSAPATAKRVSKKEVASAVAPVVAAAPAPVAAAAPVALVRAVSIALVSVRPSCGRSMAIACYKVGPGRRDCPCRAVYIALVSEA